MITECKTALPLLLGLNSHVDITSIGDTASGGGGRGGGHGGGGRRSGCSGRRLGPLILAATTNRNVAESSSFRPVPLARFAEMPGL